MFLWIVFIMQRAITHFRILGKRNTLCFLEVPLLQLILPTARRSKTVSLKHPFSKLINIMLDKINGSELKHELEKWFFRDGIFFPRWWWVGRQVLLNCGVKLAFLDRDPYYYTRRVKEAVHIRLHPNDINRVSGREIPEAWMPTIKKHNNRRAVRLRTAEGANHL